MSKFRLSRRAVLRGAGSIAIALPWLEIMTTERTSQAATAVTPPARFLSVYTPGGTVLDKWRPSGTETDFTLGPILQPLAPLKDRILVLDGIDMKSAHGEQHQSGMIAWLTGTKQPQGAGQFATAPSIDQVLAPQLSVGKKLPSLEVAVRWGTGKSRGLVSPMNIVSYSADSPVAPIQPRLDPRSIWQELFGAIDTENAKRATWDKSMLDAVGRRYVALAQRLGKEDKARLEQHLEGIRQLEKNLADVSPTCAAPTLVDTSDYDPAAGLRSDDIGVNREPATDAAIPKVGKLMMDMLVMAMACDLTAVGTMQWSDSEAKFTFPWLNLLQTQAYYRNDGGYHPAELTTIFTWFSEQHAYLLRKMAETDMGGHSLLDESVVFFGSQIQAPATHAKTDMPFLLAGGGGLRTGRWVQYPHVSHNDLLIALLNLFGNQYMSFGDPAYCTGPLANLT